MPFWNGYHHHYQHQHCLTEVIKTRRKWKDKCATYAITTTTEANKQGWRQINCYWVWLINPQTLANISLAFQFACTSQLAMQTHSDSRKKAPKMPHIRFYSYYYYWYWCYTVVKIMIKVGKVTFHVCDFMHTHRHILNRNKTDHSEYVFCRNVVLLLGDHCGVQNKRKNLPKTSRQGEGKDNSGMLINSFV